MRIATIGSGVLLVGTGIWCFANPGATFLSIAFILGTAMFISGFFNILSLLFYKERIGQKTRTWTTGLLNSHNGWQLADGLLSVILSAMLLSGLLITEAMLVVFFGMWVLTAGVLRVIASAAIRMSGLRGWYYGSGFGILSIAAGIFAFANPILAGFAMVVVIGIIFLLQGANQIVTGIHMKKA